MKEVYKEDKYDESLSYYKESSHCGGNCGNGKEKHHNACVEDILAAILKAQKKVEKEQKGKCSVCDESFDELLEEPKKFSKNTIPFILYCGCKPFKAESVSVCSIGGKDKKFVCVTSFIFKIVELKGNCAKLELLTFKSKRERCDQLHSPCEQVANQYVHDLMKTGVCITVDLSCFCGISVLPAVRL